MASKRSTGVVVVRQGLVYEGREAGGLTEHKLEFARSEEEGRRFGGEPNFGVEAVRATALVGAAARRGTFSREVLGAVARVRCTSRPIHPSRRLRLSRATRCCDRERVAEPSQMQQVVRRSDT